MTTLFDHISQDIVAKDNDRDNNEAFTPLVKFAVA